MVEKIQRIILFLIVCLAGYLVYEIYGNDIIRLVNSVIKAEETAAETEAPTEKENGSRTGEAQELPARYDAREDGRASTVKDQGEFGTCWAVTASSALEAALLPKERLIFSADHISMRNAYGKAVEEGGAYAMAISYLAGWMGPVAEEDDPYGDGKSPEGLSPIRHVQEMQILQEKDITEVKKLVYQCGAVQSSFYMDMENASHSSVYYNEFEHAYCYAGGEAANHDVLIIGWDDSYPKSSFSVDVKRDGAFICQNSWGESFGENGIFYVSYEDALIGSSCVGYTRVENTDNYENIYQTDLCGWVGQIGYGGPECYFANVYTAERDETLAAVGFYATGRHTEYTVYVAEEFSNSFSLIGKKAAASGSFENGGYYTVNLEKEIKLEKGQRFAVAVKIYTPDAKYPVAAEYRADEDSRNVTIEDGEGYLGANGISWQNTEESYGCNVCLKAYTGNGRNGNGAADSR